MIAEKMVSRGQGGLIRAAAQHQGYNEGNLDDGDRRGEYQCSEGLAEAMRYDLGMVYGGDDGADETRRAGQRQERADGDQHSRHQQQAGYQGE